MNSITIRPRVNGIVLEHLTELSLEEVSRNCAVQADFINELIEEGIIAPLPCNTPASWRFTSLQIRHLSVAWRLQRDLGVNLPGAALALQLLDELEALRAQIAANAMAADDE